MSLLPQEVHTALTQLLGALSSPDNNARSQAEEQLNNDWWANRPDVLLMGLVEQMQGSEDQTVSFTVSFLVSEEKIDMKKTRSFAAVIFRRMSSKIKKHPSSNESKETFLILGEEQKIAIRSQLLQALSGEQIFAVRNKIGDAVAELARQYTDNGSLLPACLSEKSLISLNRSKLAGAT